MSQALGKMKITKLNAVLLTIIIAFAPGCLSAQSNAPVWIVGKTNYPSIAAAVAAVSDGEVIEIADGQYENVSVTLAANNVTVRGVGGRPRLNANGKPGNGKGHFYVTGNDSTLENLELYGENLHLGAENAWNQGAIFLTGKNIKLRRLFVHDNGQGIFTAGKVGTVDIRDCEFARNGEGGGHSHNLYINHQVAKLVMRGVWSHDGNGGHILKSRALESDIQDCRFTDPKGTSLSWFIDFPNAGNVTFADNVVQAGSKSSLLIAYGEEQSQINPGRTVQISRNTFVNSGRGNFFQFSQGVTPVCNGNIYFGPNAPINGENTIVDITATDRERILKAASDALKISHITIADFRATNSPGGANDFYSNSDYWWPDPTKPDGFPFIQRDGETNPNNFNEHRMAMRNLRDAVAALGADYKISGDNGYAEKAAVLLKAFFLDEKTRMNPRLDFAQVIPGHGDGKPWGIIDALHLIEIPQAISVMEKSPAFTPEIISGLKKWFADLSSWMLTSKLGKAEAAAKNNHAVAFWLQIACYAKFTGDEANLAECRRQFKEVFLPNQMAADGSFPRELARTKPYAYSVFQLDNMATLCQVLSTPTDDLWKFELPDGRGIRKAVAYLYPFLADKSKWPLKPDVMAWAGWPVRQSSLLFAGLEFGETKYLELWNRLPPDPMNPEVRRNIAITQPVLWLKN